MAEMTCFSRDGAVIKLHSFDGQTVWHDSDTSLFEVGNFLGGGAAGNVYECEHLKSRQHFALKILNPLGYKLMSPALLRKCNVVSKGETVNDLCSQEKLLKSNIWWLINGSTKQFVAAFFSEKHNCLKELSLVQCIQVWGPDALHIGEDDTDNKEESVEVIQVIGGARIYVPTLPPKFADFIRRRNRIFREIRNMRKIPPHKNVIRLEGVLELTQESKCTIFLVMELANGGELFDRIKLDCGAREDTAKLFFQQLLLGVMHCHTHGVCHRDLKPENLLLQDTIDNGTILKIADFGFSARFAMGDTEGSGLSEKAGWDGIEQSSSSFQTMKSPFATTPGHSVTSTSLPDESLLRVLKSVVGSPFYVAPEVLQARGYDGPKADVWSLGVILYAMLAGNLPFEQELSTCKRFRLFCKWVREQTVKGVRFWNDQTVEYPQWLFPAKFSMLAKGLIVAMLHPDPDKRVSVTEAMGHPLCAGRILSQAAVANPATAPAPASSVTFALLPVAVAAPTSVSNSTAIFQTNCHFDSDSVSIPIASAVVTALGPVAITMSGASESDDKVQMQCSPTREAERYSLSLSMDVDVDVDMDVESESGERCLSPCPSSPRVGEEECSPPSNRVCDDARTSSEEIYPSPCRDGDRDREQDDIDDGVFYMEEETPCPRGSQSMSNKGSETGSDFPPLSNTMPSTSMMSPNIADWNDRRHSLRGMADPRSTDISMDGSDDCAGSAHRAMRATYPSMSTNTDALRVPSMSRGMSRSVMNADNAQLPPTPTDCGDVGSPSPSFRYLSHSPKQMPMLMMEPPVAPLMTSHRSIDDLITAGEDDFSPYTQDEGVKPQMYDFSKLSRPTSASLNPGRTVRYAEEDTSSPVPPLGGLGVSGGFGGSATNPPSFNDSVKRSTRFITAVPASEVLDKVESILEQVRLEHVQTPIGIIGKIAIYWAAYRIEVWGADTTGPPLCALQLYQMPASTSTSTCSGAQQDPTSPNRMFSLASSDSTSSSAFQSPFLVAGGRVSPLNPFMSPGALSSSSTMDSRRFSPSLVGADSVGANGQQHLFLAEFVRGQLEIFAFKRFYQWVRQRLSQLVKRDYAFKLLDHHGSPMVDSYLLQRIQQCSS